MRPILFAIAAAGFLVPAAAIHGGPADAMTSNPRAADQTAEAANEDEVVCRRESVIGSRVQSRRICKTRAEWVRQELQSRDSVNDLIQRTTSGADRVGG